MERQDVDRNILTEENKTPTDQTAEEVLRVNKYRRAKRQAWIARANFGLASRPAATVVSGGASTGQAMGLLLALTYP